MKLSGFGLQLFGEKEAVSGKKIVYMYRLLKENTQQVATNVAFTTENATTLSRDADTTETKDGQIRTPGAVEGEITTTAILAVGDTMIDKLKKALVSGEKVEIWKINMAEKGEGDDKFKATYFRGYVTEFEETSNAEDHVECSLTFGIEGSGADGEATVPAEQQEMIEMYGFADTTKNASAGA